jgi:hypothetical protein
MNECPARLWIQADFDPDFLEPSQMFPDAAPAVTAAVQRLQLGSRHDSLDCVGPRQTVHCRSLVERGQAKAPDGCCTSLDMT